MAYQFGKVYKLISENSDVIYIGSSKQKYLCNRKATHISLYKRFLNKKTHFCSSFKVIACGDVKIVLLENYPCDTKDELLAREQYWIDNLKANGFKVINKNCTVHNHKQYMKQYETRDYVKVNRKKFRDQPEEKEKRKKRNQANRLKNPDYYKTYLAEYRKQKYACHYCKISVRLDHKVGHCKTIRHKNNMKKSFQGYVELMKINKQKRIQHIQQFNSICLKIDKLLKSK